MIARMGTAIKMNSNNWPTYSNNSGFSTSGRSHDGQWHHYVLVWNYDTGYRQAYIDGSLVGQFQQVESGTITKGSPLVERDTKTTEALMTQPGQMVPMTEV